MRIPMIAGNWKLNISLKSNITKLLNEIRASEQPEVVVFPPYLYLQHVYDTLQNSSIKIGAQDVSVYTQGSFTGEISASMLKDMNCSYSIIGHSERRKLHGETDKSVYKKFFELTSKKVTPIVCVGETLEQRKAGNAETVILKQLTAILEKIKKDKLFSTEFVIAYEPVWAIGTGESAQPDTAQVIHSYIRSLLNQVDTNLGNNTRILYGGSISPDNASELLMQKDIDGGLIGKASVISDNFNSIIEVAKKIWSQ